MKQRKTTVIALICGCLCAICMGLFLYNVQGQADAARAEAIARFGGEQASACVMTRDVAAGERVDASAVEMRTWVSDLLPQDAVLDAKDAIGKTATSALFKGEVVTTKHFDGSSEALDVPEGMAAVSLPAKATAAVGGAIAPGSHVDIYATGNTATKRVAQDVLVLDTSLAEGSSATASSTAWITVAVNSSSVQELIASSNSTDLYFSLPAQTNEQQTDKGEGK